MRKQFFFRKKSGRLRFLYTMYPNAPGVRDAFSIVSLLRIFICFFNYRLLKLFKIMYVCRYYETMVSCFFFQRA